MSAPQSSRPQPDGVEEGSDGHKTLPLADGNVLELSPGAQVLFSTDASTLAVLDSTDEQDHYCAVIVDREARTIRQELELPRTYTSATLGDHGRHLTVTDENTVVLYELR